MRMRPGGIVMLALLAVLVGCGERERRGGARPADSLATSIDPATVPGQVALELWQLRDSVSFAEWNADRPEPVQRFTAGSPWYDRGDWCAYAERRAQVAGHEIERDAFFYPPGPPQSLELPAETSPERLIIRGCALGLVWVRVSAADSAAGAVLADSVRAQLTRIYGRADTGEVSFGGSAFWTRRGRWRRGSISVVSALSTPPLSLVRDTSRSSASVVALAYLPRSGMDAGGAETVASLTTSADTLSLDSAVALSALDTNVWNPLKRALAEANTPDAATGPSRRPLDRARLLEALRRWLAAAGAQPAGRRAAALFVADQVLGRSLCAYGLCEGPDSARFRPFRALGAKFEYSPLGDGWVFTHNWLQDILTLGLDGPVSNATFMLLLEYGFDTSGTCRGGGDNFRDVIAKGEAWLARHPQHQQARAAHFLVAEAYRDIVALAHGALAEYADSAQYLEESPAAREKALEHYRLAIPPGDTSRMAREAWQQAWWLMAELPPRGTRFVCVYD
ncbi:MAG: hypothetical protein Q7J79_08215 [Gemmatimonadales bacterium]|nr:hypothetical protein [Gemmatimonadales bacterium]